MITIDLASGGDAINNVANHVATFIPRSVFFCVLFLCFVNGGAFTSAITIMRINGVAR